MVNTTQGISCANTSKNKHGQQIGQLHKEHKGFEIYFLYHWTPIKGLDKPLLWGHEN
jgi:hypothetical protein